MTEKQLFRNLYTLARREYSCFFDGGITNAELAKTVIANAVHAGFSEKFITRLKHAAELSHQAFLQASRSALILPDTELVEPSLANGEIPF